MNFGNWYQNVSEFYWFFSYNEKKDIERRYIGTQEWSHEDTHQVWAPSFRITRNSDVTSLMLIWEIKRFSVGSEVLKNFPKSTNTYWDSSDKWLVQYDEAWKEPNSLQNSNRSSRSQTFENHLRLFDRTRDSRKNSTVSEYGFYVVTQRCEPLNPCHPSGANNWTRWKFPRNIFQFSLI